MTEIQKLYEKIPKSSCKEGCFLCCYNSVQMADEEMQRMGGYEYSGKCSHLIDCKCTVYPVRPFVCRIFGSSILMKCDDCIPERFLGENETKEIIKEYTRLMRNQEEKLTLLNEDKKSSD